MAEIAKFTQPDSSPAYFIDFLDFLDKQESIKELRVRAAAHLRLAAGRRVLDVGCGLGGGTFPLAEITRPTGLAAGVDISSAMIEEAKRRSNGRAGTEFQVGQACAIPYPDHYFDAARSERVFLYLPDRLGAIHEMKRVVKRGGRIVLLDTDMDSTAIYSKKLALTRKLTSIVAATMPNPNSARELPALIKQAGLRETAVETLGLSTPHEFFLRVMAGALEKAVKQGIVPDNQVKEWLEEQAALAASGDFFQTWHYVVVSGTV